MIKFDNRKTMKQIISRVAIALSMSMAILPSSAQINASVEEEVFTVIANPGERATTAIRLNWHTPPGSTANSCIYTTCDDSTWRKAKLATAEQEVITAFDSLMSKTPEGKDCFERITFVRNTVELNKLKPGTHYMYRIGNAPDAPVRYFKTAPKSGRWSAAVISDFHAYTPLPHRVKAAMTMLDTLEQRNSGPFDLILHVGDICAWGGSYSFWRDLYTRKPFERYAWAGVNGNHDNMDRKSTRLSNDYFHYANNNPMNGYDGEMGVCYHFTYGKVLFIMLNNESMRTDEGLAAAQQWVRETIRSNKADFVVVMEHYQWFYANTGRFSQYERWHQLFDECGVDLAIGANHHIYARTNAIYQDKETDGTYGTVYVQTPSSDNERGMEEKEWTENKDLIKFRWTEGAKTVGALLMHADNRSLQLTLYNREGKALDNVHVWKKKKRL